MGMFDELELECPHCATDVTLQSKAGDCVMACYNLRVAPLEILADLEGTHGCTNCGESFTLHVVSQAIVTK